MASQPFRSNNRNITQTCIAILVYVRYAILLTATVSSAVGDELSQNHLVGQCNVMDTDTVNAAIKTVTNLKITAAQRHGIECLSRIPST